ncbi:hypothetical protein C8A00DRAFT_46765 [Chaetomidium leptoderma]|uniref:Zn(2)-C6 fungal-type domain-containing protein n=1 Tax=Chaetomidium leptoderma TaxID=669021 RepID=A0AAN6ZSU6_9PEZI|nr:hypothetical protein C8A00DRAFT_46765 [Chaetomidium leptoderma]
MASHSVQSFNTGRFPTRARRERRACVQCTTGKRKCGKEAPSCVRCCEKGIVCKYLPRPNNIRPGRADTGSQQGNENGDNETALARSSVLPSSSVPKATFGSHFASTPTDQSCNCRWFLSADSWTVQYGCLEDRGSAPVSEQTLPYFISKLKAWAAAWVRDGHSPLMHKRLYGIWVPDCIQDCLTSLAAYNAASPSSGGKATALRIIDDRVNRLVQSQPQHDNDYDCEVDGGGIPSSILLLPTRTHLARTQALFVYQLIRLFDGDIRARAQAERHTDTLLTWARQMVESARLDCASAEFLFPPDDDDDPLSPTPSVHNSNNNSNNNPFSLPPAPTPPPSLWQAWIHAESVRRIYTAAISMLSVYDTLRQGWSVCPGMIAFTAQSGLWDAGSGYAWLETLRGDGGRKRRGVTTVVVDEILQDAAPEEVDQFAVAMLEISFGIESVEKWVFEKGRAGRGVSAGGVAG